MENVIAGRMPLVPPFCITIDHQSLEDKTVTVRHRDSMQQERIAISALQEFLEQRVSLKVLLKTL